jgi:signal transduction histidine kinase
VNAEEPHAAWYRFVPVACVLSLVAAFVVDLLTPQLLVTAILLDVPIVLSSLGSSARFRLILIIAALACDVVAGYVNGLQDGHHWDVIAVADRFLAAFSVILVGYLSSAVIDNAQRAGRAEVQGVRSRREAQLAAAIERVRASLSTELVLRAVTQESLELLNASEAHFAVAGPPVMTFVARRGQAHVEVVTARLPPAGISLVQRVADEGDVVVVRATDAFGRLVLDTYGAPAMLVIPVADRQRRFGVLLVLGDHSDSMDDLRSVGLGYANQAADALEQARLFEQLAERNLALAEGANIIRERTAAVEERSGVIRDLVYALSHDLRTPLAALGMTLRQAHAGAYGELPLRYREIVERSIIATDDVQRLAETLLLVARFESGDRHPQRNLVDLWDVARQIAGELEAVALTRRVELTIAQRSDMPVCTQADRDDVRRAITNLVANALEHTPPDGHVDLAVHGSDGAATIRVTDDGYGVSEKARVHLFTRFARGDDRGGAGSGLGLYIVHRVAAESGGLVTYEPNVPRGSIFTLRLPAVPPA